MATVSSKPAAGAFASGDIFYVVQPGGGRSTTLGALATYFGSGGGGVTSVGGSGGTTGLSFTGGPVTTAGTLTLAGTLIPANGGTGFASYVVGDLTQASTTSALAKLAAVAIGNVLLSGGIGVVSAWGKVGLTTHVTGTLPVANGGTNTTTSTGTGSNVLSASPSLTGKATMQGFATAIVAKSAAYTATTSDNVIYCDTTTAGFTITLPAAAGNAGLQYIIKKTVAANTLTVDANASETIDGALTATMTAQYDALRIICDGTGWHKVGQIVTSGSGTVTSVAALTFGTTGTDLGSSVATGTTTPIITLNVPTASAANRGALSAADWSTFNGKQAAITILPTANGGTNNAFFTVAGPATTAKTFTFPNASATILTDAAVVTIGQGGSGQATANTALNAFLPSQATHSGKVLSTNGTDTSWIAVGGSGTVTSVAALTIGTAGTDLGSSVATGTTTPVITLNVPTASAANRGALSAADWSAFNGKQAAITFGAGVLTFIGTPSSANLLAAVTGSTGTGALVFGTAPAITLANGTGLPLGTGVSGNLSVALGGTGTTTLPLLKTAMTFVKADVGLSLVEDTALSTWAGSSNITTLGNIGAGVWGGTAIAAVKGGTGQTVYAVGDLLYASTTTALSKLADVAVGNVLLSGGAGVAPAYGKVDLGAHVSGTLPVVNGGTANAFFTVAGPATTAKTYTFPNANATILTTASLVGVTEGGTGVASLSALKTAMTFVKADVGLSLVENTALSTWVGTSNITTLGNIGAGVWGGTAIAADKGGTGQTVYAVGDLLFASTTTALSKLAAGTSTQVLTSNGPGVAPSWQASGGGGVLNNYAASAAPTVSNDSTGGYGVGSAWIWAAAGRTWVCTSAAVGAATWLAVAYDEHVGHIAGNYYRPGAFTVATVVVAADILYATPFQVVAPISLDQLAVFVGTVAAGTSCRMGIYSNVSARPGAKLFEGTGSVVTSIAGVAVVSLSATMTLLPGTYWPVCNFNGAPSITGVAAATGVGFNHLTGSSNGTQSLGQVVTGVTAANTFASGLPATFPASTVRANVATPFIGYRAA